MWNYGSIGNKVRAGSDRLRRTGRHRPARTHQDARPPAARGSLIIARYADTPADPERVGQLFPVTTAGPGARPWWRRLAVWE